MQAAQAVGKPRNRIRLAGTGAVLNQIIMSRPIFPYIPKQLCDDIQLVIAGKYHAFLFDFTCFLIFF